MRELLVVQWLGPCAPMAGSLGMILVRELRSLKLCCVIKKKKKKRDEYIGV